MKKLWWDDLCILLGQEANMNRQTNHHTGQLDDIQRPNPVIVLKKISRSTTIQLFLGSRLTSPLKVAQFSEKIIKNCTVAMDLLRRF